MAQDPTATATIHAVDLIMPLLLELTGAPPPLLEALAGEFDRQAFEASADSVESFAPSCTVAARWLREAVEQASSRAEMEAALTDGAGLN